MCVKTFFKKALILFFIAAAASAIAQESKSTFYFKNAGFENDYYKIYIEEAVNKLEYAKFKILIINKTSDYLIYKPSEVIFSINGQKLTSDDRQFTIAPHEEAWKIINTKGKGLLESKYEIIIQNLYKVSLSTAKVVEVDNLYIPTTMKSFTVENFQCNIQRLDIKKKKSRLKFVCVYKGDGIGIVETFKCIALLPKGYKSPNTWSRTFLFEKDKWDEFIVDINEVSGGGNMEKESFTIVWNDTFKESKIEPIKGGTIKMELDQAKTSERNQ